MPEFIAKKAGPHYDLYRAEVDRYTLFGRLCQHGDGGFCFVGDMDVAMRVNPLLRKTMRVAEMLAVVRDQLGSGLPTGSFGTPN